MRIPYARIGSREVSAHEGIGRGRNRYGVGDCDGLPIGCWTLAAQVIDLPLDAHDAISILQGTTNDGLIPARDIQKVVAELTAIRKAAPDISTIHGIPLYELTELIVFSSATIEYIGDKTCQLTPDNRRRMRSSPFATGIWKFDKLNRKFGAERISPAIEDGGVIRCVPSMFDSSGVKVPLTT